MKKLIAGAILSCVVSGASSVLVYRYAAGVPDNPHTHWGTALYSDCPKCVQDLAQFVATVNHKPKAVAKDGQPD